MKIADAVLRGLAWLALGLLHLTWWGLSHPLGDLVALVLVAVLFWRFNLGARAQERNRARAMRWRARCRLRPGPGFASLAELGTQWGRLAASGRGGRARPGLPFWAPAPGGVPATAYALRLGRAQWGKRVFGSMEANWLMISPPRKGKSGYLADVILSWPGAVLATSTRADLFSHGGRPVAARPGPRVQPLRGGRGAVLVRLGRGVRVREPGRGVHPRRRHHRAPDRDRGHGLVAGQGRHRAGRAAACGRPVRADRAGHLGLGQPPGRRHRRVRPGGPPGRLPPAAVRVRGGDPGGPVPGLHPHDHGQVPDLGRGPGRGRHGPRPRRPPVRRGRVRRVLRHLVHDRARRPGRDDRAAVPLLHRLRAAQATLAGSRRPEGKLDPPLLPGLDEARQIVRVPLDLWLADSAGKGVTIVAVAHGLGQLREGWGADGAATIWDTTNKIILPGVTDRDCLDAIQDICGTVGATEGDRRVQVPAVPAAFVRRLRAAGR